MQKMASVGASGLSEVPESRKVSKASIMKSRNQAMTVGDLARDSVAVLGEPIDMLK